MTAAVNPSAVRWQAICHACSWLSAVVSGPELLPRVCERCGKGGK